MRKRDFIGGAAAAIGALFVRGCGRSIAPAAGETFEVVKSDREWRAVLAPAQYSVLRRGQTERAGSSPLDREHRAGTFHCAGCGLPLYSSLAKYDSGTGWPSFTSALPGAVRTKREFSIFGPQTEVHCRRCGGHLGHVFDDGPAPTGKRHCMNGAALEFIAAEDGLREKVVTTTGPM